MIVSSSGLPSRRARKRLGEAPFVAWMRRLALAVVAIAFSTGVVAPEATGTRVVTATFDVVRAQAEHDASQFERSHPDEDRSTPDLKPIELDDDDDDDSLHEHGARTALSFRLAPLPPKPDCVLRGVSSPDTSRVVARPGVPRGPPV